MKQKDKDNIMKLIRENLGIEVNDYMETINIFHCDVVFTARHIAEIIRKGNPFDKEHGRFIYRIITDILIHFFIIYEDKNIYYICKDKDNRIIRNLQVNRLKKPIYVNIYEGLEKTEEGK